jgi:hypothetical protein
MLVVRALVAGGQRVVVTGNGLGDVGAMSQQGVCGVLLGTKNNPTYTDAARHAAALLIDDNEPEVHTTLTSTQHCGPSDFHQTLVLACP